MNLKDHSANELADRLQDMMGEAYIDPIRFGHGTLASDDRDRTQDERYKTVRHEYVVDMASAMMECLSVRLDILESLVVLRWSAMEAAVLLDEFWRSGYERPCHRLYTAVSAEAKLLAADLFDQAHAERERGAGPATRYQSERMSEALDL